MHPKNFENPMQGMFQTLFQRAMSSGLYFPLEDIFRQKINSEFGTSNEYRSLRNFAAGTCAGMVNAILMNPASSVKVCFITTTIIIITTLRTLIYTILYVYSITIGARQIVAMRTSYRPHWTWLN